jgi:nucleotidyltransferase substrate binding protein (TIGR01987 family)
MERLIAQQKVLAKALRMLSLMVEGYHRKKQELQQDDFDFLVYQSAVVKHFEISFDLLWKYLKQYLFVHYGVDVASPKKVFKETGMQRLCTDEEVTAFLKMCDDRNMMAHTYDPDYAYEVAESVLSNYFLIKPTLYRIIEQAHSHLHEE